jgi:glycosyltransferase involved in cell wall biosynthesis
MMPSAGRRFWDAEITLSRAAMELREPRRMTAPYDADALDLTVFISCYNEAAFIIATIESVTEASRAADLRYEILVIDDGSRDNSVQLVAEYIRAHPAENVILRANRTNKGLAQNYIDGAFLGHGKYYRLICGDNAEPKESILTVFKAIGKADIIIPYYYSSEGKSLKRRVISNVYTALINLITKYRLHYYNGLAVHLRYNVMRWHPNTHGFGFQADILCLLLDLGFSHLEVPIIMVEQRRGTSNALTFRNFLSVAHTLVEIANRRISNRVYRRREPQPTQRRLPALNEYLTEDTPTRLRQAD